MLKKPKFTSPKHIRFVATLDCAMCGVPDNSQSAHVHKRKHSIKGGKVADAVVPLCHDGANGCHTKLDSYKAEDHRDGLIQLGWDLVEVSGNRSQGDRLVYEYRVN